MTDGIVLNLPAIETSEHSATARAALRRSAEAAARGPILSVVQKPAPALGGTLNDYWSVGPYWWPDPASPSGLPFIRRDGHVHPDFNTQRYDRSRLEPFCKSIPPLAFAAMLGEGNDFATNAVKRIRAWFIEPATRMNPNLRFGQSIPGRCEGRGIGLIDTHELLNVIDSCFVLRHLGALSEADFAAVVRWFSEFLEWMLTHPYGMDERRAHNNHGTWCDAQLAGFALFVGRKELAREVIAAVPKTRIDLQIEPDGRQPHELERTRSLTYSCFNLSGLFSLAWMGRHVGEDLWSYVSPDGRSLRAAVEFLAPYANADRPWRYPELQEEAHLPPARARMFPVFRQAARAWKDSRYRQLAEECAEDGGEGLARIDWP